METTIKEALQGITSEAHQPDQPLKQDIINPEDVQLTDDEIKTAIAIALQKKQAAAREKIYWDKVRMPKSYPQYTAEQLFEYAVEKGKKMFNDFVIDQKNEFAFHLLSLYFSGDQRFNKNGLSLSKGIALIGPVGCGKTVTMRCFSSNPTNSFREISARVIANEYATNGASTIDYYSNIHSSIDASLYFGQKELGLFIDDLGTEDKKKYFGNEEDVLQNIILNRYDNPYLKAKTHMTSNLSGDQIGEFYGLRVRSRVREMFNWIPFEIDSPDRRK